MEFCNLRSRAVVDALANGRFALKAAATVKQLCFWINQHGIVLTPLSVLGFYKHGYNGQVIQLSEIRRMVKRIK